MSEPQDQEMAEYLALKAALKGGIRSASGRTWRRKVVEAVCEHPLACVGGIVALVLPVVMPMVMLQMSHVVLGAFPEPEGGAPFGALLAFQKTVFETIMMYVAPLASVCMGIRLLVFVFTGRV